MEDREKWSKGEKQYFEGKRAIYKGYFKKTSPALILSDERELARACFTYFKNVLGKKTEELREQVQVAEKKKKEEEEDSLAKRASLMSGEGGLHVVKRWLTLKR
jgi:carboxylesterase type B